MRDGKGHIIAERVVIVGGSAGSLSPTLKIVQSLPERFGYALIFVLHRQRNVSSEMSALLSAGRRHKICEPDDKATIEENSIYLAPQNYHLLLERERSFSLDYSEPVLYSRPSINVTLESAALAYGPNASGIILSGANADGSAGLTAIIAAGGTGLIHDPEEAEYPAMPGAAVKQNPKAEIKSLSAIVNYLVQSNDDV
jgi:two-component system chemotaxis response regulator CheB